MLHVMSDVIIIIQKKGSVFWLNGKNKNGEPKIQEKLLNINKNINQHGYFF